MGNRGDLHAPDGSLGPRRWKHKAWITCTLEGKGWHVNFDQPGSYYPLFFHDEAVALAAGHRPCGQCRPEALERFKAAWRRAYGLKPKQHIPVREIDDELHRHRTARVSPSAFNVTDLPDGTFVELKSIARTAALIWNGVLYIWEPDGYRSVEPQAGNLVQKTLTPVPIIQVLSAGYLPTVATKPKPG